MHEKDSLFSADEIEKLEKFREEQDLVVILGSSSSSRRKVFEASFPPHLFTKIVQISPDIDEKAIRHDDPEMLTKLITQRKDSAVFKKYASTWEAPEKVQTLIAITSDQVSVFRGGEKPEIREKPVSIEENRAFLRSYSNSSIETCGFICVHRVDYDAAGNMVMTRIVSTTDINTVYFNEISEEVITKVISRGDSMHCSGGFVVEDEDLSRCVNRIDGSVEGVMGLDTELLHDLLMDALFFEDESADDASEGDDHQDANV